MKKIYTLLFILSLISCSTKVQYVGSKFSPGKNLDVYVTASSIKKTYTIMGQGFIKTGYLNKINWDKVQKQSVKKGKQIGADAVLIVQKKAISPLPALNTYSRLDSVGKGIQANSNTESYYPVSSWHDIFYLKYN